MGGLGNQMFEYLFSLYLRKKYPNEKIYGHYPDWGLWNHNGLEIDRVFDVELPKATLASKAMIFVFKVVRKLTNKKVLWSDDKSYNEKASFFTGYWQDRRFYSDIDICNILKFKNINNIPERCSIFVKGICESESVSIHVRRGDYLAASNAARFCGIATAEYYRTAIQIISEKYSGAKFFVFSDDLDWVKSEMQIPNAEYVDCNSGENSWLDMYLMSQCKHNIIANSTFAYWGAMLNANMYKTVIYPAKWFKDIPRPEIFPDEWIAVDEMGVVVRFMK